VAVHGRPTAVEVVVDGKRWSEHLPAVWPPPSGALVIARAGRAWRSLRSLSFVDRLASGPGQSVLSTWQVQAPDRVAYQVWGGADSVIIENKRWDRGPGATKWVESSQAPIRQPAPFWVSVADAHVLGAVTIDGRPAWHVSFFDPQTPAWFDVMVDRKTFLTLNMHMITTAHFMFDTYGQFNSTARVVPPPR
jgi:hypothetical protein